MKLAREEFEAIVRRVLRQIPEEFQPFLKEVSVVVQNRATKKLLKELDFPADEDLLGLFDGTPRTERSVTESIHYPDTIFVYQQPLEEMCESLEELEEEIEITVVHELAHYMGIEEDRLEELGYD